MVIVNETNQREEFAGLLRKITDVVVLFNPSYTNENLARFKDVFINPHKVRGDEMFHALMRQYDERNYAILILFEEIPGGLYELNARNHFASHFRKMREHFGKDKTWFGISYEEIYAARSNNNNSNSFDQEVVKLRKIIESQQEIISKLEKDVEHINEKIHRDLPLLQRSIVKMDFEGPENPPLIGLDNICYN